jgi:hypothetical protein
MPPYTHILQIHCTYTTLDLTSDCNHNQLYTSKPFHQTPIEHDVLAQYRFISHPIVIKCQKVTPNWPWWVSSVASQPPSVRLEMLAQLPSWLPRLPQNPSVSTINYYFTSITLIVSLANARQFLEPTCRHCFHIQRIRRICWTVLIIPYNSRSA